MKSQVCLPDNIHSSSSDLGVATHDWHAGCEGPVNAEDNTLCVGRNHGQVGIGWCVVTPGIREERKERYWLDCSNTRCMGLWMMEGLMDALVREWTNKYMYRTGTSIRYAPVFGTSEHYEKTHGSLLSGWMIYNYTACCWFPTSSNILIPPSEFWQIRFESCWLYCSKCRILALLRYMMNWLHAQW